jgi:hypothetical protein
VSFFSGCISVVIDDVDVREPASEETEDVLLVPEDA